MKEKWIVKNLIGGLVFLVAVVVLATVGLRVITRHGKTVVAPDFTNLTVPQARALAHDNKLSVKVVDSVFVRRLAGGVVYRQLPRPGATVKQGRSIFLTINSVVPRKVVMPNLFGYSVTEARSELRNRSLNLGRLIYVKDIATNTVLGQAINGAEVKPGDLVVNGSFIDLTVGVAEDGGLAEVPRLVGMKYVNAVDALHAHFLNIGKATFDKDIRTYADSMNAVVYRQDAMGENKPLGSAIGLSLTLDSAKLPAQ